MEQQEIAQINELPVLPLRDVVAYPFINMSLFVARDTSKKALELAVAGDRKVILVTQKSSKTENPDFDDIYKIGIVAKVIQHLQLPDNTIRLLILGEKTCEIKSIEDKGEYKLAKFIDYPIETLEKETQKRLTQMLVKRLENYLKLVPKPPKEMLTDFKTVKNMEQLIYVLSSHLKININDRQKLLEYKSEEEKLEYLIYALDVEFEMLQLEKDISDKVRKKLDKTQKDFYLNERIKAFQSEINKDTPSDFEEIEEKIKTLELSEEAHKKAEQELKKLKAMTATSAEANVVRSYLDWLLSLPWGNSVQTKVNLTKAAKILDEDHYGLEDIKERILDYLAVQQRVKKMKGGVLCFVGPPGVGKTSLAASIARAVNRKYVRIALGGVRDEAEIRGHRRTYVGSLPGKIIQKIAKVGVKNPLFLLDEIDKLGSDHRGDPASALLEVLDPEQNKYFADHYLEVDFDLSEVMFICTANSMNIPDALLDRMEVIRLAGYTEDEKLNIAKKYLLPKQMQQNGVKNEELDLSEQAILEILRFYTKEAGVRDLERQIMRICRKRVRDFSEKKPDIKQEVLQSEDINYFLGERKFSYGLKDEQNQVGRVNGLAWTKVGGELLHIEAATMPGKSNLVKTGSLGEVMQESVQAALTVIRSRSSTWGLADNFFADLDIHLHVPEGATPKDGPSAGITMAVALLSALTSIPVRVDVAMTGEINLRGEVLPIGGLKEKLLAAKLAGIKTVIIPRENTKDLREIGEIITNDLEIIPVQWFDEVLSIALEYMPMEIVQNTALNLGEAI